MKQFIEEYGLVILAVFAISTLIVIATPLKFVIADWIDIALGTNVKTQENWANKNNTYKVKIKVKQINGESAAYCYLDGMSSTDEFILEYQIIDGNGKYGRWTRAVDEHNNEIRVKNISEDEQDAQFSFGGSDDKRIRVRIQNAGLNDNYWIYSEIVQVGDIDN